MVQECHSIELVPSGSDSNNVNSQLADECYCDEKCSSIEIVSRRCPQDTSSQFPCLAAEYLDDDDKDILRGHLQSQFRKISMKYANLISLVIQSLTQREITPAKLVETLIGLEGFIPLKKECRLLQDRLEEMNAAKSIADIFIILKNYSSVYNHEIIEHIVDKLGANKDKRELDKYKEHFKNYCRCNIFECPMPSRRKKSPKHADLVLKIESMKEYTVEAIQLFRSQLIELLKLTRYTLNLDDIQKGCLQVTFLFPRFLKTHIFPLNADQKQGLRGLNVISLECDGVPQPFMPSKLVNICSECIAHILL